MSRARPSPFACVTDIRTLRRMAFTIETSLGDRPTPSPILPRSRAETGSCDRARPRMEHKREKLSSCRLSGPAMAAHLGNLPGDEIELQLVVEAMFRPRTAQPLHGRLDETSKQVTGNPKVADRAGRNVSRPCQHSAMAEIPG